MIKFGTSGFRGIFAVDFTKENVQKIAFAISAILKKEKKTDRPICLGFDNRFMGRHFAEWVAEVLVFNEFKVVFFENSVPSPFIAFETKNNYVGIMITASHNYYYNNGIKIFLEHGRESDDEFNQKVYDIASNINYAKIETIDFDEAIKKNLITLTTDTTRYLKSILNFIEVKPEKKRNIKVLFNAMHGSSVQCMKILLDKIGVKYEIMKEKVDPYFEKKVTAPYVYNISDQIEKLRKENFDFGFALDGDGDRVSFIDKSGEAYDCNYISAVIYDYLIKNQEKTKSLKANFEGNIVKNYAVSELIVKTSGIRGFKSFNAKVGFKNIANLLLLDDNEAIIGVESNGIAVKGHLPYKDGLMAATILINIIISENKTIKMLIDDLKRETDFPSETLEFAYPISEAEKARINEKVFIEKQLPLLDEKILRVNYEDGFKMIFQNDYWAVIRFSGTENVVRIFAEMKNKELCQRYIKTLEKFIGVSQRQ